MFVNTWRAWLHNWMSFPKRRSRTIRKTGQSSESLEGRFFLGQLAVQVPELEETEPPTLEPAELVAPEVIPLSAHEELALALEAVFQDLALPPSKPIPERIPSAESKAELQYSPRPESESAGESDPTSDDEFDFSTMSDADHAGVLLDALKGGDELALGKAAARRAARIEKKLNKSAPVSKTSPGLMVHDEDNSTTSGSDGTTSSGSPSSDAGNSNSPPSNSIGNTGTVTAASGSSGNGPTGTSSLDQVMLSWADLTFANSGGSSTTTSTGGQTYLSGTASQPQSLANFVGDPQLTAADVELLLERAAKATPSEDAIIAVVDRQGNILGVRTEAGVSFADTNTLVFAIDGAVAKARTAAFFSSDQGALTSRTVRFISQSTVTQREVESNPSISDMNSTTAGPGFVAPIGLGGHFPPNVQATPVVDLFGIEHTNRDSIDDYGGGLGRFNALYDPGQEIDAPGSYGLQSGLAVDAQPRGIATLPGGIPLYRDTADTNNIGDTLVGGIGVFFPGTDGFATHEQGFVAGDGKTTTSRTNASKVLEAEFIAVAAAGGSREAGLPIGAIGGTAAVDGLDLPFRRIDLVGITLEAVGPTAGIEGVKQLKNKFISVLGTGADSGCDQQVTPMATCQVGQAVPSGWLVSPRPAADGSLTAADVEKIIHQGIKEANRTRAAIRVSPTIGQRTRMVLSVTDKTGEVLGLYRMPDTAYFSIDVAVAKARNVAYYADASKLQPEDQIAKVPKGVAFTNRTFRFLAEPRYPAGVDGSKPPAFSILNEKSPTGVAFINKKNGENIGAAAPASWFQTVLGFDAFNIGRNFRDSSTSLDNQNGVIFFPGSAALYKNGQLVGGLGVSGDGVDQDDGVTAAATVGFTPPSTIKADRYIVNGVRLPYFKFVRNPYG